MDVILMTLIGDKCKVKALKILIAPPKMNDINKLMYKHIIGVNANKSWKVFFYISNHDILQ